MTEPNASRRPSGPKTLLRTGTTPDPGCVSLGIRPPEAVHDRGAAARRALADEIRALAARPAPRKRTR